MSKRLILFDFDGTITTKDTLLEFTKFACGNSKFYRGMLLLSVPLVMNKIGLLSAQTTKELFLTHFFKGTAFAEFTRVCDAFTVKRLPALIRPLALQQIKDYQSAGDRMIVVSASPENWIRPWALNVGMEVISTRVQTVDGKLTGKLNGKNCNGEEKANRIREAIQLTDYSEIIAYGDTAGDRAMFALAGKTFYKPFR